MQYVFWFILLSFVGLIILNAVMYLFFYLFLLYEDKKRFEYRLLVVISYEDRNLLKTIKSQFKNKVLRTSIAFASIFGFSFILVFGYIEGYIANSLLVIILFPTLLILNFVYYFHFLMHHIPGSTYIIQELVAAKGIDIKQLKISSGKDMSHIEALFRGDQNFRYLVARSYFKEIGGFSPYLLSQGDIDGDFHDIEPDLLSLEKLGYQYMRQLNSDLILSRLKREFKTFPPLWIILLLFTGLIFLAVFISTEELFEPLRMGISILEIDLVSWLMIVLLMIIMVYIDIKERLDKNLNLDKLQKILSEKGISFNTEPEEAIVLKKIYEQIEKHFPYLNLGLKT